MLANSGPASMAEVISFDSPRSSAASKSPRCKSPVSTASKSPQAANRKVRIGVDHSHVEEDVRPKTTATSSRHSAHASSKHTDDVEQSRPHTSSSGHRRKHSNFEIQTFKEHSEDLKKPGESGGRTLEEISLLNVSSMSTDSVRLGTPMQAGTRRSASAIGMVKSLKHRRHLQSLEPELKASPDGSLLSEHTRITLIPHRLTVTASGQVLVGGAETTDPKSVTSIAALAVKKHRITNAGIRMLNRLVFNSISFGAGHCAAVTDTGLVYTWGQGRYGQLGHGDESDRIVPQPVRGINGKVKAVSASFYHNAAITTSGHLFTWGDGKDGKLGHNDNAGRLFPSIVASFVDRGLHVIAAQAGGSHSVALTSYHQVYTFGFGGNGRLGHGTDNDQWVPTMVSSLELYSVVSLAAGYAHTVALTDDGQIFTYGANP